MSNTISRKMPAQINHAGYFWRDDLAAVINNRSCAWEVEQLNSPCKEDGKYAAGIKIKGDRNKISIFKTSCGKEGKEGFHKRNVEFVYIQGGPQINISCYRHPSNVLKINGFEQR